jgi:hypothetical protein
MSYKPIHMFEFNNQLYPHQWVQLPEDVRMYLSELFDIPRSGSAHVDGNVLVSDGRTAKDLEVITISRLQMVTKSDSEDFHTLLKMCINKFLNKNAKQEEVKSAEEGSEDKGPDSSGDASTGESEALSTESETGGVPTTLEVVKKRGRRKNDPARSGDGSPTGSPSEGERA